jgi:hypothetical protein
MSEIDGASAGVVQRSGSSGTWVHWIDSIITPESDSGINETLPNGDVLERGEMRDPNGVIRPYEEIWRDEIVTNSLVAVLIGQSVSSEDQPVHRLSDEYHRQAKYYSTSASPPNCVGMVIRVGDWCQGILKLQDDFSAERRHYQRGPAGGCWIVQFQINRGMLPCDKVCDWLDKSSTGADTGHNYQIGDTVTIGDVIWTLVECG